MSNKFSKFKKGFSMIELLVVIVIVILMSAILFAGNQNKNKTRDEVDAATRQLASELRSLQNDALNGKQDVTDSTPCL